jgi:deazaflavin-dependent oxidoreductase (nitroreductase family)
MPEVNDYNRSIVDEFHANAGKLGGNFEGAPMLLLHSVGARSGKPRVNPMMYLRDGDRLLVFASKAGAPTNPDWYHNLVANPDASVEVGDETFPVHATVLIGAERDRLFAKQAQLYPGFKEYEARTTRTIPVVALTRTS